MTYETRVVNAIFAFMYTTSAPKLMELMYGPNTHPDYVEEKLAIYKDSPAAWWGCLDTRNQNKLVDLACEKYRVFRVSTGNPSPTDTVTPGL